MLLTGGFVAVFLLNTFVCGKKSDTTPAETVNQLVTPGQEVTQQDKKALRQRLAGGKIIQHLQQANWGRDPFLEAARLVVSDSSWVDSTDYVLRGIIWKGNVAHALIGDMILTEGEQSGDLKVLDIKKETVVCRKGSQVITLALRQNDE